MKKIILISPILLFLVACSSAGSPLIVQDAWSRPALAGENSAVYFVIENSGEEAVLLGAQGALAERVEIHRTTIDDEGTMKMEAQQAVTVPAETTLEFAPGGYHVMLVGLTAPLVEGETIELTLVFEDQGEIQLAAKVENR